MKCVLCKGKGYISTGTHVSNCELCYSSGEIYGSLDYHLKKMSTKLSYIKIKELRVEYDKCIMSDVRFNWSRLTVGQLRSILNDCEIPDDAIIIQHRVEDVYFNKHGWDKTSEYILDPCFNIEPDEYLIVCSGYYHKERNRLVFTPHY